MTKSEIQFVRSLGDKRAREESGVFIAEGVKLVTELLDSRIRVRKVYHTGHFANGGRVECEAVSAKEMERISQLKTPSDTLAVVEIPREKLSVASLRGQLTLMLDGVQNPGNVGTIIRLADWFGIGNVICSEDSADCFNPKVVQATMGAITRVKVYYADLKSVLRECGMPVYGTFLEGESIYDASLSDGGFIVMGSEGRGVTPEVEREVTRKLFIPPFPTDRHGSESLNVAVAAAIVCSEFRRRS